jgi:lipopolysaccharide/colanic/teichoic acid biosynthesis glycosyltransferase
MRDGGAGRAGRRPNVSLKLATQGSAPISRAIIADSGRVIVVWLGVAVIAAADRPLDAAGLIGVSVAAAIWFVALRTASAGAPYVLGRWVPAAIGSTTGLVCVAALNPYLPGLQLSLGAQLGLWAGIFLSSAVWETVLERTAKRRVLVVGTSAVAGIASAAARGRRIPFEILSAQGELASGSITPTDLAPIVAAQRPDLIVLTDEHSCSQALERLLDITDRRFRVAGLANFYEYAFGCVPLRELTPLWFMSLLHVRQRAPGRPSKRMFDIVVASIGLLVTALLLPFLALAIKATPGPVVYRQKRVGEGGRCFTMYKLRTMSVTAEAGGAVFAQASDPRATRIGRFLRRTHLDELPQFLNVLKGDMSIVGPRPERPELIAMIEGDVPFWSRRLLMKPGMTGWAQVRCGYSSDCESAAEKLSHDFWYMRHGNLAVDVAVCLQTALLALEVLSPRPLWARLRLRAVREHVR